MGWDLRELRRGGDAGGDNDTALLRRDNPLARTRRLSYG